MVPTSWEIRLWSQAGKTGHRYTSLLLTYPFGQQLRGRNSTPGTLQCNCCYQREIVLYHTAACLAITDWVQVSLDKNSVSGGLHTQSSEAKPVAENRPICPARIVDLGRSQVSESEAKLKRISILRRPAPSRSVSAWRPWDHPDLLPIHLRLLRRVPANRG